MSYGTDPRRFGPSRFTREEAKTWSNWLRDPRGTDPKQNSCSGPVSYGQPPDDLDELFERMKARGVVADG